MTDLLGKIRARFDSRRVLVASAIVYFISQVSIGAILMPLGPARVLELQTSLSRVLIASVLEEWRGAGILRIFINHFYLDFFHPMFYCALLLSLLSWLLNAGSYSPRWNIVLLAPIIAAAMDLTENIFYVMYIADGSTITSLTAAASGAASIAKWALAGFSITLISALIVKRMMRKPKLIGL